MDKPVRIILYIIVGILVINFFTILFSNNNMKGIRSDLQSAKRSTDSALLELKFAKERLDSINSDIAVFRVYIKNIQQTVKVNDLDKRLKEERSAKIAEEYRDSIARIRAEIDLIVLPDIEVVTQQNH